MNEQDLYKVKSLLASPKKIAITTHRNPDGDAMGSSLGLYHFLLKKGHNVTVVAPNDFPDFLHWLPGAEKVMVFENQKEQATALFNGADIIFTLDFNTLSRTGDEEKAVLAGLDKTFIMIDYHKMPDD